MNDSRYKNKFKMRLVDIDQAHFFWLIFVSLTRQKKFRLSGFIYVYLGFHLRLSVEPRIFLRALIFPHLESEMKRS